MYLCLVFVFHYIDVLFSVSLFIYFMSFTFLFLSLSPSLPFYLGKMYLFVQFLLQFFRAIHSLSLSLSRSLFYFSQPQHLFRSQPFILFLKFIPSFNLFYQLISIILYLHFAIIYLITGTNFLSIIDSFFIYLSTSFHFHYPLY